MHRLKIFVDRSTLRPDKCDWRTIWIHWDLSIEYLKVAHTWVHQRRIVVAGTGGGQSWSWQSNTRWKRYVGSHRLKPGTVTHPSAPPPSTSMFGLPPKADYLSSCVSLLHYLKWYDCNNGNQIVILVILLNNHCDKFLYFYHFYYLRQSLQSQPQNNMSIL